MGSGGLAGFGWLFSRVSGGLSALLSNCGWMPAWCGGCIVGGGCPQVGVVCLADVSLFPGWTECFASRWALSGVGNNYRWKILLWDVADAARSLGEKTFRMWPLILVGLVKGIIQFQYWTEQMGAQCLHLHKPQNGQLWTTSEGLVVTLGPVRGQRSNQDSLNTRSGSAGAGEEAAVLQRVEDNLAKMAGKPHRVVRGKPDGDNLKKEENPAVGDNLKKEETPGIAGRHRLGGGRTRRRKPQGDNLKKEENPAEGDNLMREGAEENPDFGENLDGGMEDHAGDGNASQAGDIGAYYFGSGGWGWLPFAYDSFGSALGTGSDNVRLGTWKV
ncbi:hypothetical protein PAPYR_12770 [Paratrimastix pyriformis]|uniref:Uncharacterized protein n=1 Tax=Paratrimastix pyriformis TaxID=342808 RepID=A0ABQ8U1A9_9EUKA|nr:hypothetical protein PAPYR_12770 [Paratrimastix pyriformis]